MKLIAKLIITAILFLIPNGYCSSPEAIRVDNIKEWAVSDTVTATIYNEGYQTASGIWLDQKNPKKHRIIAISRDLLERYSFGDKVLLMGAGKYDGEYVIEDLMNKRWKKKIDILINPKDKINKFYDVRMVKLR